MVILLIWIAVLIVVVGLYLRQVYSGFSKHGIKHETPVPFLGNSIKIFLQKEHLAYDLLRVYNKFPEERFIGRYEFVKELIIIRDLELVKQICVKDFEHFLDHRSFFGENNTLLGRSLIALTGQEWKDMRSTLSPAFTSSKIRVMIPFMIEVGDQMIADLKNQLNNSNKDYIDIDCKDLTTRYANDIIASCAFGLKVDSLTEKKNPFYQRGMELTNANVLRMMIFFLMVNMPKLAKIFDWDFVSTDCKQFFKDLVLDTIKNREINNILRPDMIHLLMEVRKVQNYSPDILAINETWLKAHKENLAPSIPGYKFMHRARQGRLKHDNVKADECDLAAGFATVEESAIGTNEVNREWSDQDLIAQAVLFFFGGFETASSAMSFLLYELAVNPDVQDRLANEIIEHDAKNGGKFDFNSIQKLTYLDMVTSELLRLWPPGIFLDRQCIKDCNLGKPNKNAKEDYIIRKGTGVAIPVFAFHRDPQYFPNPDKFDPERFAEENKHNIHPFAYMPFGVGPRNCIGSRFALCEMKAITYQILLQMEVSPSESTLIPAVLAPNSFNFRMKGGHNLRFKIRP